MKKNCKTERKVRVYVSTERSKKSHWKWKKFLHRSLRTLSDGEQPTHKNLLVRLSGIGLIFFCWCTRARQRECPILGWLNKLYSAENSLSEMQNILRKNWLNFGGKKFRVIKSGRKEWRICCVCDDFCEFSFGVKMWIFLSNRSLHWF